jgi:hypothetical protein
LLIGSFRGERRKRRKGFLGSIKKLSDGKNSPRQVECASCTGRQLDDRNNENRREHKVGVKFCVRRGQNGNVDLDLPRNELGNWMKAD